VTLGDYVRGESLRSPDQFTRTLAERSYSAFGRIELRSAPRLHVSATLYDTRYSTFGTSVDFRIGASYRLSSGGVARFNVGTGFRAPLLSERYVIPTALLVPDQNCVAPNGNPNLQPEQTTEYELGYGQKLGADDIFDLALYRTNLRIPIENFYPLGTTCPASGASVVAQSFPVNVGNAIYQGGALTLLHRFGAVSARIDYAIDQTYPTSLPADFVANPTSGSNLVPNQQFAGISPHTGALDVRYVRAHGSHFDLFATYRGKNNELHQGPYAEIGAAVGSTLADGLDVSLAAQNVTNAVSGRFTLIGQGVPYPTPAGPIAQNALFLEPASIRLILTYRR
jgi:outer membrane receptor protein involved in Fe transport